MGQQSAKLTMPNNVQAEMSIIGGLISNPALVAEVATILKPEDFYYDNAKKCFKVILEDFQKGREITMEAVHDRAKADILWLSDCMSAYSIPAQVMENARLVKQYSQRRKVIHIAYDAISQAQDITGGEEGLAATLDYLQQGLMECSRGEGEDWEMNSSLIPRHFSDIEKRKGTDGITGVTSGFKDLDSMTAGWHPGQLIFLGAVPKQGKTSMAMHFALKAKVPVLFFTLEMLPEEIADRQFAAFGKVSANKIKTGNLSSEDWHKLTEATGALADKPVGWVKKAGLTVTQIKAMCRRFQAEHGLGLVIIDQLDKISERSLQNENRSDTIGRTTRALKLMAMDLEVPVVCLTQLLDKQVGRRDTPRPKPGDIRDSSYPEQDADVVLFMWRPCFYWPEEHKFQNKAEVIISRQRSGATGSVWVRWDPGTVSFDNLVWTEWPEVDW